MSFLINPKKYDQVWPDEKTRDIMVKTIEFFEKKGLKSIKEDDRASRWYDDFVRFLKENEVLATLLTPSGYGDADSRFDLSRVSQNATLVSVLMTCSSAWMESALLDPNGGQRWVIYDEAWRLMSHPALLRRMDAHWRLARHYGIANMLIFHKLTDLDNVGDQGSAMRSLANSLLANAETRIVYRQESDQLGPTATALGLTGTEQQLLPKLGVGQGLWRIKARSFVTQHQLHPAELALFDTSSRAAGGHR